MAFRSANLDRLTKFNSAASSDFIDFYEGLWNDAITSKNSTPKHKTFAPSSFRCLRINWFRLRGVQPDTIKVPDRTLDFSANVGTACHEFIQSKLKEGLQADWIDVGQYIKDKNLPYIVETKGYETLVESADPPVRFACDGLIRWNNKNYLLEIKTSEFSSFDELTNPKDRHIDQVKCYCTLLDLNNVLFLYQDRQYGGLKCFEMSVSEEDKEAVRDKMRHIQELADACIAPDKLPKGDPQCTAAMCPYYNKCKEW